MRWTEQMAEAIVQLRQSGWRTGNEPVPAGDGGFSYKSPELAGPVEEIERLRAACKSAWSRANAPKTATCVFRRACSNPAAAVLTATSKTPTTKQTQSPAELCVALAEIPGSAPCPCDSGQNTSVAADATPPAFINRAA
jgi:hypothetical protein